MAEEERANISAVKSFLTQHRHGVLSTISVSQKGFPFGSIVPYDIDPQGNVYIYISLIAEHYRNLKADSRASLIATDPFGRDDPQAYARATLLAEFTPVAKEEAAQIQAQYELRFPNSINYELAHNFLFMKGKPAKIRWIGGFGDIRWFDGEDFSKAAPDLLAYSSMDIISHMNEDHADAVADLFRANSNIALDGKTPLLTGISSSKMTLQLKKGKDKHEIVIPLIETVREAEQARSVIIRTLKAAREKLC